MHNESIQMDQWELTKCDDLLFRICYNFKVFSGLGLPHSLLLLWYIAIQQLVLYWHLLYLIAFLLVQVLNRNVIIITVKRHSWEMVKRDNNFCSLCSDLPVFFWKGLRNIVSNMLSSYYHFIQSLIGLMALTYREWVLFIFLTED